MPSPAIPSTAIPPTSLTARIHELVSACFTGIWLETGESRRGREHEDHWLYGGFLPRGHAGVGASLGHEWTRKPAAGVLCEKRQLRADSTGGLKEQGRATDCLSKRWLVPSKAKGLKAFSPLA